MKIRNLFGILVASAVLAACSDSSSPEPIAQVGPAQPEMSHPNVVFILVDDMGFGDVGYNGSEIATPNLDQLAATGMRLDRNYVFPICSPTRAALLTGHNPLDYGIDGPMSDETGLPLDLKIMPQYFKELGYQTFMVGKWHLGIGNTDYWPTSRGFDSHYGFLGGWVDFYSHVYAGGLDWQREGKSLREEGHATDLFTAEAKKLIASRDTDSPFFLYLAYNAPHSPLQNTPTNSGLNGAAAPGNRAVYAEMVTQLDARIAEVIDAIKAQGILENTIIIFSSDNGGSLGLGAYNGDLRGGKGESLEGGMRVPGVFWWPGHVEGGQVLEQPIAMFDWLPTLLDAVGGDSSVIDHPYGQSMWSAIDKGAQIDRARMIIGARENRAVFDWPWKMVRQGTEGELELYNIVSDPTESRNLAAQEPQILDSLAQALAAEVEVASKRDMANGSTGSFYANGEDADYDYHLPESRAPWAEAAVRGTGL